MRAFFFSLLGYFLTPWGLILMGALDSSLIFFLPLGIDFAVIILSARKPEFFWLYSILATSGSVLGAAVTFWIGRKVGEHGLTRLMKPSRLERVRNRVSHHAGPGRIFREVEDSRCRTFQLSIGCDGDVQERNRAGASIGPRA